jgi:hypothetical protein
VLLEKPGLGEEELREIQREALNRMLVFDAAPRGVQRKAQEKGEAPLHTWWNGLDQDQREAILDGRPWRRSQLKRKAPETAYEVFHRLIQR